MKFLSVCVGCLLGELEKKILKKLFGLGKEKRKGMVEKIA
jgi:hypothetical protein